MCRLAVVEATLLHEGLEEKEIHLVWKSSEKGLMADFGGAVQHQLPPLVV